MVYSDIISLVSNTGDEVDYVTMSNWSFASQKVLMGDRQNLAMVSRQISIYQYTEQFGCTLNESAIQSRALVLFR